MSARAILQWCDILICLNHASTDRTEEILEAVATEHPNRVTILRQPDPEWNEMDHRQSLLVVARELGATHIAMIDADEVVTGDLAPMMRAHFEKLPEHRVLTLPWLCLRDSIDRVMVTGMWSTAMASVGFKDDKAWHWKPQGAHGYHFHHRHPMGRPYTPWPVWGHRNCGLMHLQFVNERRLMAKHLLYGLTENLRWPNRQAVAATREYYGRSVYESHMARARPVPENWWAPYRDLLPHLKPDAEPWQLAECRRLIAEHPGIEKGLDCFGLEL